MVISYDTAVYKLFGIDRNTWLIELLLLNRNNWNDLTVCKHMIINIKQNEWI